MLDIASLNDKVGKTNLDQSQPSTLHYSRMTALHVNSVCVVEATCRADAFRVYAFRIYANRIGTFGSEASQIDASAEGLGASTSADSSIAGP